MKRDKKIVKQIICTLAILVGLLNVVAALHAYRFTHFTSYKTEKTKSPDKLSSIDKIKALLFGIANPRPVNEKMPNKNFSTIYLKSNKKIECWYIKFHNPTKTDSAHGTVIIFHGYGGKKSDMLDKYLEFSKMKYNVLLVDFMGSGGSDGSQTTLGYKEAEEVKTTYNYILKKGEKNVYLFGTSMGAVAIMKAIHDYDLKPTGIIIECPFASMYQTVSARFNNMNIPSFPMATLLVFWGGIENGFWAFGHNPKHYASKISCPALLLYGQQDKNVSRTEIDEIYLNLKGKKVLKTYKRAGHENYLLKYKSDWVKDIAAFLIAK